MRSASTQARTDEIIQSLKSSNLKAEAYIEVYDSNGSPILLNDLDESRGISWKKSSKKYKFATQSLTPLASTISFTVINEKGKYSEGSGTAVEGLFDLDTKIRLTAGYKLDSLGSAETTTNADLTSLIYGYTFYTQIDANSQIALNPSSPASTAPNFFEDIFNGNYGASNYGSDNYSADAFYVYDFDLINDGFSEVTEINVNTNNTSGNIYYRNVSNLNDAKFSSNSTSNWTDAGATIDGVKTITPTGNPQKKHLLVAVVYDGVNLGDDLRITAINIKTKSFMEFVYRDVFYLDTPSFAEPAAPGIPTISCSGRDVWKRIIETDVNVADLSSGISIDGVIKNIADQAGVQYNSTSIDDLTSYANRVLSSGLGATQKAVKPLESLMQILNKTNSPTGSKYQMYLEYDSTIDDNILFVTAKPTAFTADFVFNYQNYLSFGASRKNYDKILKRATVLTDNPGINDEELLDSSLLQTGTGVQAFSWVNNAGFKRIEFTTSDNGYSITDVDMDPTATTITVTAGTGTGTWSIRLYGSRWKGADPTFEGESLSETNSPKGLSNIFVNPFLVSDDEAKEVADGLIEDFAIPVKEANGINFPYLNLLLEINDFCLVWSRFNFVDDLYPITGISYKWDRSSSPSDSTSFNLDDSGTDFSDVATSGFIYDDILDNDIGYLYDMSFGPQGTQAESEAAYTPVNNIGFS